MAIHESRRLRLLPTKPRSLPIGARTWGVRVVRIGITSFVRIRRGVRFAADLRLAIGTIGEKIAQFGDGGGVMRRESGRVSARDAM